MEIYLVWTIIGFILLFLEATKPKSSFLNSAAGAFFASCVAYFYPDLYWAQMFAFVSISLLCFLVLKNKKSDNEIDNNKKGKTAE